MRHTQALRNIIAAQPNLTDSGGECRPGIGDEPTRSHTDDPAGLLG